MRARIANCSWKFSGKTAHRLLVAAHSSASDEDCTVSVRAMKRGSQGAGSAAKVPRTEPADGGAAGGSEVPPGLFDRGLSLRGLRTLAATADGRSCREMWRQVWLYETVEPGWSVQAEYTDDDREQARWIKAVYTNSVSGEQMKLGAWAGDLKDGQDDDSIPFGAPAGCTSLVDARADVAGDIGRPTHFLSFPWTMPFADVVEAAATVLGDAPDCFLWMDLMAHNYHKNQEQGAGYNFSVREAMDGLGLLQVCSEWSDPERMKRLWMMLETSIAVSNDSAMFLGLTGAQRSSMADSLRNSGPSAILDVVYNMEFDPTKGETHCAADRATLLPVIEECCAEVGGRDEMNLKLAGASRRAYAQAIAQEFEQRWQAHDPPDADTLDLGHQLGMLWALTSEPQKAEELFRRVLEVLKAGAEGSAHEKRGARSDRTTAELVKVLRSEGRVEDAHEAEREMSETNELAVSWEGINISFLEKFVEENREAVNFLSTDAVVERIIKPKSASKLLYDPEPQRGQALIEMTHEQYKGTPSFFLSHAWRQTFSVCDREWRGGLAQAVIHAIPEAERRSTFVWTDIFCVNQHLRSPYGGLLAFAFEPLRNAMLDCDRVLMFFETWDDPAPLTRVWCLDELRNSLLLGKDVKVIMPPQALASFKAAAAEDEPAMLADIERVTSCIDIKQASATFRRDRTIVLATVEETLGAEPLNRFCREIVRKALMAAAGLQDQEERSEHGHDEAPHPGSSWPWAAIFAQLR